MNKSYSQPDGFFPRWITPVLQAASQDHPVVVLTGARQVGKTTLLSNAEPFRDWRFHSLDDFATLQQARENPESLWADTNQIVLDEVQKAPELLSVVKQVVDRHPRQFRFMLSGSANLLLMNQVSESLAGRAIYFILDPMTLGEAHRTQPSNILSQALSGNFPESSSLLDAPPDPTSDIQRGLMPPLLSLNTPESWARWWEGYVATYLERDLHQVSLIENLLDFRRLMELAALRSAQLLNQSDLARDAQLSQPTAHRYLNILETTHMFERLPAFTTSRTTRIVKTPKIFLNDTGLAVFLSGYFDEHDLREARELGAYLETLVYHHLRVLTRLMTPSGRLYFWRTRSGREVDFVMEHGRRILAIEVKRATQVGYGDAAGLRAFLADHPKASGGLLLYGGREIRYLDKNVVALPWTLLTG